MYSKLYVIFWDEVLVDSFFLVCSFIVLFQNECKREFAFLGNRLPLPLSSKNSYTFDSPLILFFSHYYRPVS